jgi:hypothetical protein
MSVKAPEDQNTLLYVFPSFPANPFNLLTGTPGSYPATITSHKLDLNAMNFDGVPISQVQTGGVNIPGPPGGLAGNVRSALVMVSDPDVLVKINGFFAFNCHRLVHIFEDMVIQTIELVMPQVYVRVPNTFDVIVAMANNDKFPYSLFEGKKLFTYKSNSTTTGSGYTDALAVQMLGYATLCMDICNLGSANTLVYNVQHSNDGVNWTNDVVGGTGTLATSTNVSVIITSPYRFYRVQVKNGSGTTTFLVNAILQS